MLAFGTQEKQILIEPIFAQWIQSTHGKIHMGSMYFYLQRPPKDSMRVEASVAGLVKCVNENSNSLFLTIGPWRLLVHHAITLGLHTTTLILVKLIVFLAMARDEAVLVIFGMGRRFYLAFLGC
ncbi:hypothetical protein H5410_056303 [Solanum commersonii]|uniref:Uncharacterized protein n=1 Tax=Solanum commersonii TaxID=4109 RepID=A0A9J5WJX1_SOLCO|nr:hypothetical protein H5410_056303 [Solanum commersonii]